MIGLAGRRSSGKNTVGTYLVANHGFREYAFADALKRVAARLGWRGTKDSWDRRILQDLGMGMREEVDERVWIDAVERALDRETPTHAVVTDVRLPNEVDFIRSHGGVVWRIDRPDVEYDEPTDAHATEQPEALDVDAVILNDGSLDDLHELVEMTLAALKTTSRGE